MIRNTEIIKVGEVERGFRTGTYAWGLAVRESGCLTNEEFIIRLRSGDIVSANALFYSAAIQYAQWKNIPVDFNAVIISEFIEEAGEEKMNKVLDKLLESYLPKNPKPPQETGEIVAQQ